MRQLFLLFLVLSVSCTQPNYIRVLIVRHGEKMVGKLTRTEDLYPNNIGAMHAWALVPFFEQVAPSIDAIYAAPQGLDGEISFRPMEICAPTAAARGITINANEGSALIGVTQTDLLAKNVREYAKPGDTVLICWEHDNIPNIAKSFGVTTPPPWYNVDFSSMWELHVSPNRTTLSQHVEQLPNQFNIPATAFSAVPISVMQTNSPLQYEQLLNFCPMQHACEVDWLQTIACCDDLLYPKKSEPTPDTSACTVTRAQCFSWYGQPAG